MKCPTCGAENEASNRFCEQCGSRITPSGGFQPASADLAAMPTAAGPTCPSCGAAVLPGEAFCDECGASLTGAAPSARNDAPTMLAAPASMDGGAPAADQGVTCPSCGHQNLPGDRFCDNCGAELIQAPARSASVSDAPTIMAEPQAPSMPAAQPAADPLAATVEQPALVPDAAPAPDQAASAPPAADAAVDPAAQAASVAPTAEAPAATPPGPANSAQADYEAAQQRLNDEIGRQQQIIAQFEQMQAMFGAATPAAVTQGLAEARDAKARAESELAALTGGAAPAAPAAPAVPPAEAAAPAEPAAAAPAEPAATMPTVDEAVPPVASVAPPTSAPAAPADPAMPAPPAIAAPRLVFGDGQEIALPADKREIIVGREDPISGIFPEVDLTPHGGESGGVSRQHARLSHDNGQWTITDLNSTNYTRVDGAKIDPNVPVPIASGAKLQFGRVAMTFQI
jgi:uncharacterized OB-fold protein